MHSLKWLTFILVGLFTGLACFVWEQAVEAIVRYKWRVTQDVLTMDNAGHIVPSYIIYLGISLAFGMGASLLTLKLEPLAAGGGSVEMMSYFNGVNYPGVFSWKTLIVKFFGLMFALGAGLCIGKEGVLAHIGSIIGYYMIYLPIPFFIYFRNNEDKRLIASAGTAAGVAAAFGSPIGGTMYAYEMAAPTNYWSFELTWMLFVCSAVSVFVVNILDCIIDGKGWDITNGGVIKFGFFSNNSFKIYDLIGFAILGAIGGCLGSFFCFVNYSLSKIRKRYLTNDVRKFIETSVIVFVTATLFFWAPYWIKEDCLSVKDSWETEEEKSAYENAMDRY